MIFAAKNRDEATGNGIALAEDFVMISISCPNDAPELPHRRNCVDLLRLEFDDIDQPVEILGGMKCVLFQPFHAKAILDFYRKHKGSCKYMIIHCDAGISRSRAVVCALKKIHTGSDYEEFKKGIPNRRVYSLILAQHYLGEKSEEDSNLLKIYERKIAEKEERIRELTIKIIEGSITKEACDEIERQYWEDLRRTSA